MNRKLSIILKNFFFTVFLLAGVFSAHTTKAQLVNALTPGEDMSEWYSTAKTPGHFIENKKLILTEIATDSNTAQLRVQITPTGSPAPIPDATDPKILEGFKFIGNSDNTASPTGYIESLVHPNCTILGSWCALYEATIGNPITVDGGSGVWIDIEEESVISPDCLNDKIDRPNVSNFITADCYDSPTAQRIPFVYYLLTRKPAGTGRLNILNNIIDDGVRFYNLKADTAYVARIRLEENDSPDMASSRLVHFKTKAVGGQTIDQQGFSQTDNSSTIDDETGLPACSVWAVSDVMGCVGQIIYYIIYKPTNWIMVLAGEIMDWGIHYSISSSSYPVTGHSFVTDGWRIMRDIANICFIFILVYLAITTILGQKKEKMIGMVILVALIINFSLFFSKVVVDFGNITSRFFYNLIAVTSKQADSVEIIGTGGGKSISYGFASVFNPAKLLSGVTQQSVISTGGNPTGVGLTPGQFASYFSLFSIVAGAVNLVAAFVFFSLAWLFLARTAGIWLAIIASPLAFLSLALPTDIGTAETKKYTNFKSWWENLSHLAIMPTIALLLIFLIFSFLKSNMFGSFGTEETTTGKFMAVLVPLAVLSYLLLATKKIATDYSGDFGAAMGKVGSFVGGAAIGVATGGAALALRKTVGAGASRLAESSRFKNFASNSRVGAYMRSKTADIGNATFDARNVKVAGKTLESATGMGVGKVSSKGYIKDQKDKAIKQRKTADSLGPSEQELQHQKQLENEAKRKALLRDRGEVDPYTNKIPTDDEVNAAAGYASKEKKRLDSVKMKRRENYAQQVEQGTNLLDYAINKTTRLINNTATKRDKDDLAKNEAEAKRLEGIGAGKKDSNGKIVTQTEIDKARGKVSASAAKISQTETGRVGSYANDTAEKIRSGTKVKGDNEKILEDLLKAKKDEEDEKNGKVTEKKPEDDKKTEPDDGTNGKRGGGGGGGGKGGEPIITPIIVGGGGNSTTTTPNQNQQENKMSGSANPTLMNYSYKAKAPTPGGEINTLSGQDIDLSGNKSGASQINISNSKINLNVSGGAGNIKSVGNQSSQTGNTTHSNPSNMSTTAPKTYDSQSKVALNIGRDRKDVKDFTSSVNSGQTKVIGVKATGEPRQAPKPPKVEAEDDGKWMNDINNNLSDEETVTTPAPAVAPKPPTNTSRTESSPFGTSTYS